MDRAACHGSEHPPPPPDRPLAARGPGRKPWHILGENGWRILTENLHRAAGIDPDRPDDDPDPREDVLVVTDGRRVGRAHDADDLALGHPRAELLDLLPVEVATTGRAAGRDYERHRECEQGDSGKPTDDKPHAADPSRVRPKGKPGTL